MDLDTLLKHTSRSLYLSAKILPKNIRRTFGTAYLLCRYADTIADTDLLPAKQRIYWIQAFPQLLRTQDAAQQAQLTQALNGTSNNPYETQLITHLADCLQAFNTLPSSQKKLIEAVVEAVCKGMKIDLMQFPTDKKTAPQAFMLDTDLTHYCRLMGGKPGLFWSQLIFHSLPVDLPKEVFYNFGQQVGDALQMVNILRDLPQDVRNGRCYFPQTDLETKNLKAADLLEEKNEARFKPIKQKWIAWGKQNLTKAVPYYRAIPKKHWQMRAAVAWPMLWTADTFAKLNKTTCLLNPKHRVKISRLRVYLTLLATPPLLASNFLFERWFNLKLKKLS